MASEAAENLVELVPSGETFMARTDETILDAALRQGIALEYGCRHGNCSTCKHLIEEGDVDLGEASAYSLPDDEREDGWALLCCATALTPLVIRDNREADDRAKPLLPPAEHQGTVTGIMQLTPELWELSISLEKPMMFYAGQFAELGLPGEGGMVWRSYSMASSPSTPSDLKFVIKRIPNGAFSGRLDTLQPGATLEVRGPFGTSYLRGGERPVLFASIGSGLAPILSMLRDARERYDGRSFTFYYGARRPFDLPYLDEIRDQLASAFGDRLRFVPTLDGLTEGDYWHGSIGTVTQAIQRDIPDAHDYDVYLCGAPAMCDTVARLLAAKGLPENQLFFDRFFPAAS